MTAKPKEVLQRLRSAHQLMLKEAQLLLDESGEPMALAQHASKLYHLLIIPHFRYEEEVLYPRLHGTDSELNQSLFVAKDDHAEIELLFQRLETEVNQISILREIPIALEQHIDLEESEVFHTIEARWEEFNLNDIPLPKESKAL